VGKGARRHDLAQRRHPGAWSATPRTAQAASNGCADGALIAEGLWPARIAKPSSSSDKLTLAQLCEELQIARSTFYEWRAKGRAPKCIKLPNGDLRIRRTDLDRWLAAHEESDA
jgi:predicted DNA-binding transcriptional regulator AlpA